MRRIVTILLVFSCCTLAGAQDRGGIQLSGTITGDLPQWTGEYLTYFVNASEKIGASSGRIRFRNGDRVSDWIALLPDDHGPEGRLSQLGFLRDKRYDAYEVEWDQSTTASLYFYDPGPTEAKPTGQPISSDNAACFCVLPTVVERPEWCPEGNCLPGSDLVSTEVTHLIVHHSAGVNEAQDWAGIVRAIWNLHVVGNGWSDIGYNYLIDPDGIIYVGRGNDIRGAHFCGNNTGTMGVCLLGNFTEITPTEAAMASLAELLAWKSCDRSLATTATTFHQGSGSFLPTISGHRDGCATQCPGNAFYPSLADFPEVVDDTLNNCQPVNVENPVTETVTVAPNPSVDGRFRVDGFTGSATFMLYDPMGRRVQSGMIRGGDFIEANQARAASGVYTLVINLAGRRMSRRMLVW